MGFVAGHRHRQPAHPLGVLDFHVAVAEGQQPSAGNGVFAQNAFDDHFLGEALVVVAGAVDPRAEVPRDVQQLGLGLDERLVGAAGQVERTAPRGKLLQQPPAAVHEQLVGRDPPVLSPSMRSRDPQVQSPQIFVLVPQRLARLAAPLADPLGELDHLVDRLLAVKPHDVVEGQAVQIGVLSPRSGAASPRTSAPSPRASLGGSATRCRRNRTAHG